MKYIVVVYIALGLVLSAAVGIEYTCNGSEVLPEYTGSPFVFRQKSLGSSMTYFYSVFGLIFNTAIWTIVVLLLRKLILHLIERVANKKPLQSVYRIVVGLFILFSTLNIWMAYMIMGTGFGEGMNDWYIDKEAQAWGAECTGQPGIFLFPK
ncbi:MAG: hypothetical protein GC193_07910 [Cryomorphaceae bacterium]|nr:hypothetical protein [Cryomorphaceae bacterium]